MHVVIFEDIHWRELAPLSLSRPVFMLATGMTTLLEKQLRHTNPSRLTLWVRPELVEFCRRRTVPRMAVPTQVNAPLDDQPALLVSGRTLHFRNYEPPRGEAVVLDEGDEIRIAYVHRPGLTHDDVMRRTDKWMSIASLPRQDAQTRLVDRLWDLIKWNEQSLIEDFAHLPRQPQPRPAGAYYVLNDQNVWIGPDVVLHPGVMLDGSGGPVVIDHHAKVGANAVIEGPSYVGPYATVMPLTHIRAGTSIGTMSKVGGVVGNSIMFGYSNKAHEGYVGDSYIGKWVNLGAGTTTSNLKNTYGEISLKTPQGKVPTGRHFLGSLIGDHAKTGICTRLMAGTYVGFSSMLAGSSIAPRFVPSFAFWTDKGMEPYRVDKAMDVMCAVFARRHRQLDDLDESVVRYVAETAPAVEGTRP